jgi:hypothetical protein
MIFSLVQLFKINMDLTVLVVMFQIQTLNGTARQILT